MKLDTFTDDDLRWNLTGMRRAVETGKAASGWVLYPSDVESLRERIAEIEAELERRRAE